MPVVDPKRVSASRPRPVPPRTNGSSSKGDVVEAESASVEPKAVVATTARDGSAYERKNGARVPSADAEPLAHDTTYDELLADAQLTPDERRRNVLTEWNGRTKVQVHKILRPRTTEEVRAAIAHAREHGLKVSVGGARHSSGGQTMRAGSLHIDMTQFRGASYDPAKRTVTVAGGTSWLDVQRKLEQHGRAVAVKQEFSVFTVGGSVSVNGMGRDHRFGPLGNTVRSVTLMQADGSVVKATPDGPNAELFHHAIGGFGLFGIVLEAELDTVENENYEQSFATQTVAEYANGLDFADPDTHFFSGTLSTSPFSFMDKVLVNTWRAKGGTAERFEPEDRNGVKVAVKKLMLSAARNGGPVGKLAFWQLYKTLLPLTESGSAGRNEALTPPYKPLWNPADDEVQALDVSIVPVAKLAPFTEALDGLRKKHGMNVVLGTVYAVKTDASAALRAVKEDSYVVTLLVEHAPADQAKSDAFYRDVADLALDLGGRMYLTHQLPFSREQVRRGYPELADVLETRKRYDPTGLFDNSLVELFGPNGTAPAR